MTTLANSFLFDGRVRHRRHSDGKHAFQYSLGLVMLDLEEVGKLPTGFLRGFRRRDYLGNPEQPLRSCVLDRVEQEHNFRPDGCVQMLTQLRSCGYLFNPVTFYLCHNADGKLAAMVAEITNTPWRQSFAYVLDARPSCDQPVHRWTFDKSFHVSPFHPMDHVYQWSLRVSEGQVAISMINRQKGKRMFDATLVGALSPLTRRSLRRQGLRSPLQSLRMHVAIYWHALRLYLKRARFYTHPDKQKENVHVHRT